MKTKKNKPFVFTDEQKEVLYEDLFEFMAEYPGQASFFWDPEEFFEKFAPSAREFHKNKGIGIETIIDKLILAGLFSIEDRKSFDADPNAAETLVELEFDLVNQLVDNEVEIPWGREEFDQGGGDAVVEYVYNRVRQALISVAPSYDSFDSFMFDVYLKTPYYEKDIFEVLRLDITQEQFIQELVKENLLDARSVKDLKDSEYVYDMFNLFFEEILFEEKETLPWGGGQL